MPNYTQGNACTANIFKVSADVLLGIDITPKEKRITEIWEKAQREWELGYNEKAKITEKRMKII